PMIAEYSGAIIYCQYHPITCATDGLDIQVGDDAGRVANVVITGSVVFLVPIVALAIADDTPSLGILRPFGIIGRKIVECLLKHSFEGRKIAERAGHDCLDIRPMTHTYKSTRCVEIGTL